MATPELSSNKTLKFCDPSPPLPVKTVEFAVVCEDKSITKSPRYVWVIFTPNLTAFATLSILKSSVTLNVAVTPLPFPQPLSCINPPFEIETAG